MDIMYCLLMAIYMLLAANSKEPKGFTRKFLYTLSAIMAFLAILHIIT